MSVGIKEVVARNIKALRKQKGLSQEQLCKASGLSLRFISRAENQPQNLTIESLETIATALGVSVVEIVNVPSKNAPKPSKKTLEAIDSAIRTLQSCRALFE